MSSTPISPLGGSHQAPALERTELDLRLAGTPYQTYLYAYPHKTAYRRLEPPVKLRDVWRSERKDALFLYVHVPFCEMRCGFCNLFTTPTPREDAVGAWLDALERQARAVRDELGEVRYARWAVGGGTPTLLEPAQLERLFDLAASMGADLAAIPGSIETSPETALPARLDVLRARGAQRVSIGIQSFEEKETRAINRPQKEHEVHAALSEIARRAFPAFNVDLMYGLPEQTEASWERSLDRALSYGPTELYLYPLYVRPLTTLGKSPRAWDDQRLSLYRLARAKLSAAGYAQVSMRMFRLARAPEKEGPVYCVQSDGMVGLGVGARSYTAALHYATEYAVGVRVVKEIIGAYVARDEESFRVADWGFRLSGDEQRRRFVALSLLVAEGLDLAAYRARFGADAMTDLPQLAELEPRGLARTEGGRLRLTARGMEREDNIGPWLTSPAVRALMDAWELR